MTKLEGDDQNEATVVTGVPGQRPVAPRRGEVLAGRFEIQLIVAQDALTLDYRAIDHGTEDAVLLRVLNPHLLAAPEAGQWAASMAHAIGEDVGVQNRFLPGLLDVGLEGSLLYTVEAWPSGTSLQKVLAARSLRGENLQSGELLPVLAQVDAALRAVGSGKGHGDVRAKRIFIDPDRLQLTGPFLLAHMPPDLLELAVEGDDRLRRLFAPEMFQTGGSAAADRFAVACLAHEALTGKPAVAGRAIGVAAGPIADALAELLDPEATTRAPTLGKLLIALAEDAGLPLPDLNPTPLLVPSPDGIDPEGIDRARQQGNAGNGGDGDAVAVGNGLDAADHRRPAANSARQGEHGVASSETAGDDRGSAPGDDDRTVVRPPPRAATAAPGHGTVAGNAAAGDERPRRTPNADGTEELSTDDLASLALQPGHSKDQLPRSQPPTSRPPGPQSPMSQSPPGTAGTPAGTPGPAGPGTATAMNGDGAGNPRSKANREPTLELSPDDIQMVGRVVASGGKVPTATGSAAAPGTNHSGGGHGAGAKPRDSAPPEGRANSEAKWGPAAKAKDPALSEQPTQALPPGLAAAHPGLAGNSRNLPTPRSNSRATSTTTTMKAMEPRSTSRAGPVVLLLAFLIAATIIGAGLWINKRRHEEVRVRRLQERFEMLRRAEDQTGALGPAAPGDGANGANGISDRPPTSPADGTPMTGSAGTVDAAPTDAGIPASAEQGAGGGRVGSTRSTGRAASARRRRPSASTEGSAEGDTAPPAGTTAPTGAGVDPTAGGGPEGSADTGASAPTSNPGTEHEPATPGSVEGPPGGTPALGP